MASTQPSPSQPMVVSTPSGKNRVMPTTASASGAPVAPTPSGSSAMGANPAPAAVALSMSLTPTSQTNQDLASLFECPVCFDYVLPPILQVRPSNCQKLVTIAISRVLLRLEDFSNLIFFIVSCWPLGLFFVSPQTHLLPHLPRTTGWQYPQFGHGKSGLHSHVSLSISILWLWTLPTAHRENRPRRNVRI